MRHLVRPALFVSVLFAALALSAGPYGGSTIGPDVSVHNGNKLQWEEGSHDYFTMFKTLLWNPDPANDMNGANPSADKCLTESTFVVNDGDLPEDAYVEAAYLVWTSAIDPDKIFLNADNTVTLAYTQKDGYAEEIRDITVEGHPANDTADQDFEFQAIYLSAQDTGSDNVGYFTYRADITDFFTSVHTKAREAGAPSDGAALVGSYKFSNMDCSEHEYYATNAYNGQNSIMLGGWTVILIYRSERITPKKIYIYHGFDLYKIQEVDITVGGFKFPDKPVVRLSLMAGEGDPGLAIASATECGDGGLFGGPCPPEGLQVKGQTAPQWAPLFDACNPLKDKDSNGTAFTYTEMYNCISSFYGWDDEAPTCIGGDPNAPDPLKLEYSMDVDTMLLNGEFFPFNEHFKRDDTSFMLKVSANGDMIFTNMLVVSVDTRASKYDIPVNPNTPNGREKHYCSCSTVEDSVCFDRPFYYTIKVQNWGDELGEDVTVQDSLPPQVDYVPGSTEIARTFDANGNGTDWTAVPDGAGGAFPFLGASKVADLLVYCDKDTKACPDTVLIRFKVLPKGGLPKNTVIENTAIINDIANIPYRSNTTVPLRLRQGACPSTAECPEPPKAQCGGEGANVAECQTAEECGAGKKCDDGHCVVDPDQMASGVSVEFALGKNSPANGAAAIVVPAPTTDLVTGQFTLQGVFDGGGNTKVFSFDSIKVKMTTASANIKLANLRLIRDLDGDGVRDGDEAELATAAALSAGYADFVVPAASRAFTVNTLHYFLVLADVTYTGGTVQPNSTFNGAIDGPQAIIASDAAGGASVKEGSVTFAEFMLEPAQGYFIFTKGLRDPSVLPPSQLTGVIPILQVRIASPGQANGIERMDIKIPAGAVRLGEGLRNPAVWIDTDNDGKGDEQIPASAPYEEGDTSVRFSFPSPISLAAGESKHLVVTATLALGTDEKALIEIPKGGVELTTTATIAELPVRSKEFTASCLANDPTCTAGGGGGGGETGEDEEEGGCGCALVADAGPGGGTTAGMALLMLLLALFPLRRLFSI
ncbi:MAG TPA: hypothetical protein P5077_10000 [bacterium]|nr:hypothetical protein [bacterium]